MNVELTPGADFRAVAARLRGAAPEIRKALNSEIKNATAPAEQELKNAIRGTKSRGVAGGGARQRIEHRRSLSKSGKVPTGRHGLRDGIAAGITRKITYSGYRVGVRIRVETNKLPVNQRTLPRLMNKGRWRHPAGYGSNRGSVWVTQTVTPVRWFDNTMKAEGPKAIKRIDEAARRAMEKLQ